MKMHLVIASILMRFQVIVHYLVSNRFTKHICFIHDTTYAFHSNEFCTVSAFIAKYLIDKTHIRISSDHLWILAYSLVPTLLSKLFAKCKNLDYFVYTAGSVLQI